MLALGMLGVVAVFQYVLPNLGSIKAGLPSFAKPAGDKPRTLTSIEHVIAIRDSTEDKKITDACNALLQALIQVGK